MKRPIIIIAAARSGTKLLRDMLCSHSVLVTWPCDEINPIWRYGSARYPSDELPAGRATKKVRRYVRSKFTQVLAKYGGDRVVEKTCANSLRVPYVYKIFPQAQFIHLVRDGRDVAASARRRWTGAAGMGYMLKKARWVPLRDAPFYAFNFAENRLNRLLGNEKRLRSWGPRFSGIDEVVQRMDLIEVCGTQWSRSVEGARKGFQCVPAEQVLTVRYEALVREPNTEFGKMFQFLELDFEEHSRAVIETSVTSRNIGKWRMELSAAEADKLIPCIRKTLESEGYDRQG